MKKNLFLRFLWKVPYNLILIWRIQKSNSYFHIFSFIFLLLPRFIKNVLKKRVKFFFHRFSSKVPYKPNFYMVKSKIKLIFPSFLIYIFIFASIRQKCLKNWVNCFLLRFSWKFLPNLILICGIQKSNSFFQVFSSSSLFLASFFPIFIRQIVQVKWWNS